MVTRTDDGDDVVEWKFEDILDYGKANNGKWQYLVKWEGHDTPTWQPATDLRGCDDAIWKFHDTHPEYPGPPAWVKKRGHDEERQGDQQRHREGYGDGYRGRNEEGQPRRNPRVGTKVT